MPNGSMGLWSKKRSIGLWSKTFHGTLAKPFNMIPVLTNIESFRLICHKTVAVKYR